MEGEMEALEHLSVMIALLLAMAAALMSSDAEARREVTAFFAEAFRPQVADLGGDVGYLSGMTAEPVSLEPYPIIRAVGSSPPVK
jgi:hypothetical protein